MDQNKTEFSMLILVVSTNQVPRTKCKYLCMSLVNTRLLNQYWTTWKPEGGFVAAGTFLYTVSTCLLCVFACWADSLGVTVPAGVVGLCYTPKEH